MKKLFVLFSVFFVVTAFTCNDKKPLPTTPTAQLQQVTSKRYSLNGVEQDEAEKMIADFAQREKKGYKTDPKSMWFSKDMVHYIVEMLHQEIKDQKAQNHNTADTTDGIRIYFASDPNVTSYPFNTSIILVSTINNGPCTNEIECKSGNTHRDYYEHSPDADLYHMGTIAGAPCNGSGSCTGAKLYKTCLFCSDNSSCTQLPHNIPLKLAEKMVQKFKSHVVNTVSEWFDLSLFEAIDEDTRHNGIRIYFSTKPQMPGEYESLRDAFVITSTEYLSSSGDTQDYFDCKIAKSYIAKYEQKYNLSKTKKGVGQPMDKGELCPDNCKL